jgi:hypothetical protein
MPPVARVTRLAAALDDRGITFRLRTPTIMRPADRKHAEKWLALGTPIVSGHLGLVAELAAARRDVVADYAVNVFNQHSAGQVFRLGARRIVLSVELTGEEMAAVAAPWHGRGFEVFVYGRPEGMTLEHCVLSAARPEGHDLSRSLRAATPARAADRPCGVCLPCRDRLCLPQPAPAFPAGGRVRISPGALAVRLPELPPGVQRPG